MSRKSTTSPRQLMDSTRTCGVPASARDSADIAGSNALLPPPSPSTPSIWARGSTTFCPGIACANTCAISASSSFSVRENCQADRTCVVTNTSAVAAASAPAGASGAVPPRGRSAPHTVPAGGLSPCLQGLRSKQRQRAVGQEFHLKGGSARAQALDGLAMLLVLGRRGEERDMPARIAACIECERERVRIGSASSRERNGVLAAGRRPFPRRAAACSHRRSPARPPSRHRQGPGGCRHPRRPRAIDP